MHDAAKPDTVIGEHVLVVLEVLAKFGLGRVPVQGRSKASARATPSCCGAPA